MLNKRFTMELELFIMNQREWFIIFLQNMNLSQETSTIKTRKIYFYNIFKRKDLTELQQNSFFLNWFKIWNQNWNNFLFIKIKKLLCNPVDSMKALKDLRQVFLVFLVVNNICMSIPKVSLNSFQIIHKRTE